MEQFEFEWSFSSKTKRLVSMIEDRIKDLNTANSRIADGVADEKVRFQLAVNALKVSVLTEVLEMVETIKKG